MKRTYKVTHLEDEHDFYEIKASSYKEALEIALNDFNYEVIEVIR